MSNDFIDELERELRAASRRRVKLALARVPRPPAGAAAFVLTLAVCAAVAVPLLQARSRSTTRQHSNTAQATLGRGTERSASVVRTCADTVGGQLARDWHTTRHGTVIAGPITFVYVLRDGSVSPSHFFEGLAVVQPGRAVTITIPSYERQRVSLDYTSVAPRRRFYLREGTSSVTFKPCSGPAGLTQFDGGFIVTRPQCVALFVQPAGDKGIIEQFLPFGRSCYSENHPPPLTGLFLAGNGIDRATFGDNPKQVTFQLSGLLGRPPSKPYHAVGLCQIDHESDWPGLHVYFHRGRFAGYAYWGRYGREPGLATRKGLVVGDTLKAGQHLYGAKNFHVSPEQGGVWFVNTPLGRLEGFTSDVTNPNGKVASIEAGDVGCPAMTP